MDSILFGLAGLASLIVMFLWFASAHYCCKWNLNLLWASPLFIYFAIFPKRSHHIVAIIQAGMLIAVMGMIATGWPQHFNTAILPITLTLFVRLIGKMHKREKEGVLKYRWHRH